MNKYDLTGSNARRWSIRPDISCETCGLSCENTGNGEIYRCRICEYEYCSECSLDHFGLYEDDNGEAQYKSLFRTIYWFVRKFFSKKKRKRSNE